MPREPYRTPDPADIGEEDERIEQATERYDADNASLPREDAQPTARPPPSATTEPEPAGASSVPDRE